MLHSETPVLYVAVELGGTVRKSRAIKSSAPSWDESFTSQVLIFFLNALRLTGLSSPVDHENVNVRMTVRHKSTWRQDVCVGIAEIKLADLLAKSVDAEGNEIVLT